MFSSSEFAPDNFDACDMVKELLNALIQQKNIGSCESKFTSSGQVISNSRKTLDKKQSFCSEFKFMMNNVVALCGFEYADILMSNYGLLCYVKNIIDDIEKSNDLKEIETKIRILQNVFTCPTYEWKCDLTCFGIKPQKASRQLFDINSSISGEATFLKREMEDILRYFKDFTERNDISKLELTKAKVVERLTRIYENIEKCKIKVQSLNQLCLNLGQKYSVLYEGYFIKVFEMIFKLGYIETTQNLTMEQALSWNYHEKYFDENVKNNDEKTSAYYLASFERYFEEVFKHTLSALKADEDAETQANFERVEVVLPTDFHAYLAKILFGAFIMLCKQIMSEVLSLEMTGKTTRIQFIQVFQAIISLSHFIIDFSFTNEQLKVLFYVLQTEKVSKK